MPGPPDPPEESTALLGDRPNTAEPLDPVLRFTTGPLAGKTYPLEMGSTQIGRGEDNDLVVRDRGISRHHCRLVRQGDRVEVVDMGSTNGTFVGQERVQKSPLADGDLLVLGTQVRARFLVLGSEERQMEQKLYEGATRDPLTGICNRAAWSDQARDLLGQYLGTQRPVSLALCCLDGFAELNQKFGHLAGDAILIEFTRRCRGLGKEILPGRLAGGVFALLLPGLAPERAQARIERLQREVRENPFPLPQDPSVSLTLSAALTTASRPRDGRLGQLLEQADKGLVRARASGGNQLEVVAPAPHCTPSNQVKAERPQKRRHRRCRCRLDCWVRTQSQESYRGQIHDIGPGGCHLTLSRALEPGTRLELQLAQPRGAPVPVVVRWSRPELRKVGVRFCDPVELLRRSWVAELLKQLSAGVTLVEERRSAVRVPRSWPIELEHSGGRYYGQTINLGLGGLGGLGDDWPPPGTRASLRLLDQDWQVEIIWQTSTHFGLRFLEFSPARIRDLELLLNPGDA